MTESHLSSTPEPGDAAFCPRAAAGISVLWQTRNLGVIFLFIVIVIGFRRFQPGLPDRRKM